MTAKLLLTVAGPVLAACVVLLAAWRPWRRVACAANCEWGLGVALVVGFLLGFFAQVGWAWTESPARWHGVAALALAVAVLSVMAALLPERSWTVGAWGVLAGGLGALLIRVPDVDAVATRAGLAVVILLLTVVSFPMARRRAGAMSLGLAVVFANLAGLLLTSRFAKLALMTGTLAAICMLAALLVLWSPRPKGDTSGSVVCSALIPTLALTGYAYDYDTFPAACWVLVVAAIPAVWAGELHALKRFPPWVSGGVSAVAVAIPCAVALLLALFAAFA